MHQLRGRTIKGIFRNDDFSMLSFLTEDGYFNFQTEGDCCNTVWFEHMTFPASFEDAFIINVEYKEWYLLPDTSNSEEVLEASFWTLLTSNGYIDIEVRNSHNGYYGGTVNFVGDGKQISCKHQITGDF